MRRVCDSRYRALWAVMTLCAIYCAPATAAMLGRERKFSYKSDGGTLVCYYVNLELWLDQLFVSRERTGAVRSGANTRACAGLTYAVVTAVCELSSQHSVTPMAIQSLGRFTTGHSIRDPISCSKADNALVTFPGLRFVSAAVITYSPVARMLICARARIFKMLLKKEVKSLFDTNAMIKRPPGLSTPCAFVIEVYGFVKSDEKVPLKVCSLNYFSYDELKESGAATAAAESAVALVHALCRCHGRGDDCGPLPHLQHALHSVPDKIACVHRLMRHISEETSPGVRKMLADLLESLLCADPLLEDTRAALVAALDKCNVMMATQHPVTRRAGLDLSVSVVVGLKENMELFKDNASELMMNVLRTNERDFETSYDVILQAFRDMFVLCSESVLDELMKQIVDNLINIDYCASVYETIVRRSLDTMKLIYDHRRLDSKTFLLILLRFTESLAHQYENEDLPCKWLHLLMALKTFDFDATAWKTIIVHEDFFTLKCCTRLIERKNNVGAFTLVFRVLGAYADVLVELQYEGLLDVLTKIIKRTTPKFLNKLYTRMEDCFDKYQKLWGSEWSPSISSSFQDWLEKIPVKLITENLQSGIFHSEHRHMIAAMRKMLNFMNTTPSCPEEYVNEIKSWPKVVIRIYSTDVSCGRNLKIACLIDVMAVALTFLNDDELFDVLRMVLDLGSVPESNLKIFRDLVPAFSTFLLKGVILRRQGMKPYLTHAIGSLVKYYTHTKCEDRIYEDILNIVNENSSIQEMCSLLENVKMLDGDRPLELESAAGRWLLRALATVDSADAIHLLRMLSCFAINDVDGELDMLLSTALRNYASKLPERLSELTQRSNPRAFSALLDALVRTANLKILDIVIKLAASDVESGWWDAALEACAVALAARLNPVLPEHVYRSALKMEDAHIKWNSYLKLHKQLNENGYLHSRHSTSEFCEKFFSDIVGELLSCLRRAPRAPVSGHFAYMRLLSEYTTAFILAQLMFEKVSIYALESPSSLLHTKLDVEHTWYLVREICKCCDSLRTKIMLPDNTSDQLKKIYRDFQCSNYNCMAAAFCNRRPEPKLYGRLFAANVWPLIVDRDRRYKLDIPTQGRVSSKTLWVCTDGAADADCAADMRTARTAPTRLFTRTLSDDPLRYDFLSDYSSPETETSGQMVSVCDNELNGHECAAALSGLLRQLAGVGAERTSPAPSWLQQLADALIAPDTHTNVKSFLAQVAISTFSQMLLRSFVEKLSFSKITQ
ncbi:DNA-dependent protein kinase catalytic subunit [Eumeta japonica]|uniref:DNA-dependent protein kinase catalytic subunit n=1 Tax=Eumeta variegata TaxID=151549 RepID=A0A4C1ZI59_EUMVA|nr:DNA-dependent protein kinase catalytic subunit [Eumeta japonica]